MAKKGNPGEEHLQRVRRICLALPETTETVSHGAPTFFVRKRVYAMFVNNHHNDGHIAVWIAAQPGVQESLIASEPKTYFRPPYVGVKGWVGIELSEVDDEELGYHVLEAWRMIEAKQKPKSSKRLL
ncbi:MAG: MmcQ/YjbR family DNA-binding protein [Bryobacteraceae bacterium]